MLLTIALALETTPEQRDTLLETMEAFNSACNYLASLGKHTNKYELQRIAYREIREKYGLSAQMAIRAISKVVETWKTNPESTPKFELRGAMQYDQRILSFKGLDRVSIATLRGRLKLRLLVGGYQKEALEGRWGMRRGQADLVYRGGRFFLYVVVDAPEENPFQPKDIIGVDLGIVNIATDSTGRNWSSERVENVRKKYESLRSRLQAVGTKSAKRHLKRLSGKERRFKRDVNHCISKALVGYAEGTSSAIALEDLKGIRGRGITVGRSERSRHSKWAFSELRRFIEYKARLRGVPVIVVDPRNTSRECPLCHYTDKGNRPSRDVFRCLSCGYTAPADYVGALNIRARAAVSQPIVAPLSLGAASSGASAEE